MTDPRDHVYSRSQYEEGYPPGIERHYWNHARNLSLVTHLKSLPIPANERILEIGCGTGVVVEALARAGLDCFGVEVAPAPVPSHLQSKVWTSLRFQDLAPEIRATFSVVLLLDVIEHWSDPTVGLQEIHALFPNLKHLVVYVPARREIWSDHDEHYGHFRRYDLSLLTEHLSQAGFQSDRQGYLFHSLYWAARALLARRGKRGTTIRAPSALARPFHSVAAKVLWVENQVLPKSWRGSSAYSISRPVLTRARP